MINNSFSIELEGPDGNYPAMVQPKEENGIIRFHISGKLGPEGKDNPWDVEIEPDCDGWKQTEDSKATGPVLPCFFVEEMGERIEGRLKDV